MYFSTYKVIAYIGLVVLPAFLFGTFYLLTQDVNAAIGWGVFLTLLFIPLQLWQLRRLKSRLDDYGGSIPLGWAFDWDLEDDTDEEPASSPSGADPLAHSRCRTCGFVSSDSQSRFCSRCGSLL